MIMLEAGERGRFGWMVNLAVGLPEMNEGQFGLGVLVVSLQTETET